jgi:hypothetical protein
MQQRAPRLGCSQPSGGMTVGEPSPATHRAATWRSPGTSAGRQHTVTTRFIYADRPCRLGEIRQPRTRTTRVKGDAVNNNVEVTHAAPTAGNGRSVVGVRQAECCQASVSQWCVSAAEQQRPAG